MGAAVQAPISNTYEGGDRKITRLHWNNAAGRLSHEGFQAWTGPDAGILEVIGR